MFPASVKEKNRKRTFSHIFCVIFALFFVFSAECSEICRVLRAAFRFFKGSAARIKENRPRDRAAGKTI